MQERETQIFARDRPTSDPVVGPLAQGLHWAAAAALAVSHAGYPSFRRVFPDPARRGRALPPFFAAAVRDAMRFGVVDAAMDGSRAVAVAVWLPPGAFPWSKGRKLRAMPYLLRVLAADPRHYGTFIRYGANAERVRPTDRHWYLVVAGVRPEAQRQGLGSRLIRPQLGLCAVDTSANSQAARTQASFLASPGATVTMVASSVLTHRDSCGLPEGWADHDLLAVGAGAAGLAVVEYAPIPLLLARPSPLRAAITDSILVAVDHSRESDLAVELAGKLVTAHGGTVTMLLAPRPDAALGRAIARSRRVLLHATGAAPQVVGEPRPPERIFPSAAADLSASLVVLPTGRTRLDRRMAAQVASPVGCSVLMVPSACRLM